ncbi:hypothetical protein [Streptomyces axinellae]|uniref:Uncharacterized protein n=1 Tax=Streptomyces axinellae TaxID=552788 RepID=A0ABP6CSB4_9ACTN
MTFEDEWAQHKAAASARQDATRMRLNEADGGGGGGGPELPAEGQGVLTTPAAKKKAAKYVEEHLLPDTVKAGKHAGGATQTATGAAPAGRTDVVPFGGPGELDKWEVKTGLNTAMKHWGQQVNNVLARLNGEMGALRAAHNGYLLNDDLTGSQLTGLFPPGAPGGGVTEDTPSLIAKPDPARNPNGPLAPTLPAPPR